MPKLPRVQQEYTVSCRQKYSIRFIDELDNIIKTKDDKLKDLKSTLIISILLCEINTIRIVQPLFLSSLILLYFIICPTCLKEVKGKCKIEIFVQSNN